MMKQRYGRIINITSVVGAIGQCRARPTTPRPRPASPGMTRALARELGSRGITVNCVAPGFIDTDMTGGLPEEQQTALLAQIPLGRLGKPADIAARGGLPRVAARRLHHRHGLHVNGGMYMA